MNDIKNELSNLLPDELKKIRDIVDTLLGELCLKKETNQKYQKVNKRITCPICSSDLIVKNGFKNGTQRYKCKCCNKFFSITTNTIIYHSRLTYAILKNIIQGMLEYKGIEYLGKDVGLSTREIYNIRIKIINILNNFYKDVTLKGIVEADEKYIRINLKGTRHDKMPRESYKSGHDKVASGISKEYVCIIGAIDEYDNIVLTISGTGNASTKMISDALKGKIQKGSILVTDSKYSYKDFAKENELILKQIPAGKHSVDDIYHLGEINELFGEVQYLITKCRGISTRHLNQYLAWIRYKKILKYVVEYLNQNEEFYKFSITQNSSLKSRDVCKTEMPIDISSVYDKPFL